jgi:hypothetical protein
MRHAGVCGVLIYCADYRCSHSVALSADRWSDDLRLSDVEPQFVCGACGKRGADVRPDFNWGKPPVRAMGVSIGHAARSNGTAASKEARH